MKIKRILAALLAVVCVLSFVPAAAIKAAETGVPKKARTYTGTVSYIDFSVKGKKTIKSVTTSDKKNFYAKASNYSYTEENGTVKENNFSLETYCEKDGEYTITIKFSDKSTAKIKVYNYAAPKIDVLVNGKKAFLKQTTDKECKVTASIEKGYTIKKLEYSYAKEKKSESGDITTETLYKAFKNGDKIPINKKPYTSKSEYSFGYDSYSSLSRYGVEDLFAYTSVQITYEDKYTKENEIYSTSVASVIVP
ncbi:MAG: hypothetical protein K6G81_12780 [Lachnospiraceae bacterium]|nr:hypothetical protein [Lachnospiraceae bacterium]